MIHNFWVLVLTNGLWYSHAVSESLEKAQACAIDAKREYPGSAIKMVLVLEETR